LLLPLEFLENYIAMHPQFMECFARVGKLVRGGDKSHVVGFLADTVQIRAFTLEPGRFRLGVRIGTPVNDMGHALAKLFADFPQAGEPSLIFDSIVEQRGNGHFLVPAVLNDRRRYSQEMPNVGSFGLFADLTGMEAGGVLQRFSEFGRKEPRIFVLSVRAASFHKWHINGSRKDKRAVEIHSTMPVGTLG
jgi:hypothetical protein